LPVPMNLPTRRTAPILTALLSLAATISLRAGDVSKTTTTVESTRYGLFGMLDHRSSYGMGVLPEPMIVGETDLETEIRMDWFHAKAGAARTDEAKIELEKQFGTFTFELEVPYEREASPEGVEQGIGNIEISVRTPFYQYVSPNGLVDTTFGVGFEFAYDLWSAPCGYRVTADRTLAHGVLEPIDDGMVAVMKGRPVFYVPTMDVFEFLADPREPEAIAAAVERLWTDAALGEELVRKGHARVGRFSPDDFRRRLTEILERARELGPPVPSARTYASHG